MMALAFFAVILVVSALRSRDGIRIQQRSAWRQALVVGAILFAIHAARVIFIGTADSDGDIHVAAFKDTP